MIAAVSGRVDVVFIRKSTAGQNEEAQKANVRTMLAAIDVNVPENYFFVGTVTRSKVNTNVKFTDLMAKVEANQIGTIYVESQDRFGTDDLFELFTLLGVLRAHSTRLYDLKEKQDLTGDSFETNLRAMLGSHESKKELRKLSFRSLRTRVNNFKTTGTWPTGTHPFGFGKAVYSADGKLLWVWQPVSRTLGQKYEPDATGKLVATLKQLGKIPPKNKGQQEKTVLVPSDNRAYVKAVRMIFDLYTRVGYSRRKISAKLNEARLRFYDKAFTFSLVSQILANPAYVGDTHFGKSRPGRLHSFDVSGEILDTEKCGKKRKRDVAERLIKKETHKGLIDRRTWEQAQAKLASEEKRVCYPPRNSAYYLKQLFVCGHCGKNMAARTENRRGKRAVVYVCSSYLTGRCNNEKSTCGYQSITHDDAEQLLFGKIRELNLEYDALASAPARNSLQRQLELLNQADEDEYCKIHELIEEGVGSLLAFLRQSYGVRGEAVAEKLGRRARLYLTWGKLRANHFLGLPLSLERFKNAFKEAEQEVVEHARQTLVDLREEHAVTTKNWAKATEMQQAVLQPEIYRLEAAIRELLLRAVPLSERLREMRVASQERSDESAKLHAEWPTLESREKGESLRRLFQTVTLYWDATFHEASAKPTRPRKTSRAGRFRYSLDHARIKWSFAKADLGASW